MTSWKYMTIQGFIRHISSPVDVETNMTNINVCRQEQYKNKKKKKKGKIFCLRNNMH